MEQKVIILQNRFYRVITRPENPRVMNFER